MDLIIINNNNNSDDDDYYNDPDNQINKTITWSQTGEFHKYHRNEINSGTVSTQNTQSSINFK